MLRVGDKIKYQRIIYQICQYQYCNNTGKFTRYWQKEIFVKIKKLKKFITIIMQILRCYSLSNDMLLVYYSEFGWHFQKRWEIQTKCLHIFLFFFFSILINLNESHIQQYSEIENTHFLFFILLLILIHKEFFCFKLNDVCVLHSTLLSKAAKRSNGPVLIGYWNFLKQIKMPDWPRTAASQPREINKQGLFSSRYD